MSLDRVIQVSVTGCSVDIQPTTMKKLGLLCSKPHIVMSNTCIYFLETLPNV